MLFTLFFGFVVIGVFFAWLLIHRFRVAWLEEQVADQGLDAAIAERRAEGARGRPDDPTQPLDRGGHAVTGTWPYVIAAWLIVLGAFAAYAAVTIVRGRSLSKQVPPERRRWS